MTTTKESWTCQQCYNKTTSELDPNGTVCMNIRYTVDYDKFRDLCRDQFDVILTDLEIIDVFLHALRRLLEFKTLSTVQSDKDNSVLKIAMSCYTKSYCDSTEYYTSLFTLITNDGPSDRELMDTAIKSGKLNSSDFTDDELLELQKITAVMMSDKFRHLHATNNEDAADIADH